MGVEGLNKEYLMMSHASTPILTFPLPGGRDRCYGCP